MLCVFGVFIRFLANKNKEENTTWVLWFLLCEFFLSFFYYTFNIPVFINKTPL